MTYGAEGTDEVAFGAFASEPIDARPYSHERNAQTSGGEPHATGDAVWLTFKRYHVFDKTSGVRLRRT